MAIYAHITGWGMAVPERVLTNDELAQMVDTSDEWIQSRTGIRERRIASAEETTASLAAEASLKAIRVAQLTPAEIDLIIVSTSTPEHLFPATACIVQDKIGATQAGAFDLSAACTGFIFALNMGAQAIRSGSIQNALVIGAETLSRFVDWEDRNTCVLFGDGAGAFVLQASREPGGLLSSIMRSDGSGSDLLTLPAGGSQQPTSMDTVHQRLHYIQMKGREVFRFATRVMARATREAVEAAGLELEDIDTIVPHQANMRIIEAAARNLKLPIDKFALNLECYGNTSTASIPLAVVEAVTQGRINPDDHLVLVGFGAGLTWGAAVVHWTGPLLAEKPLHLRRYRLLSRLRSWLRRQRRRLEGYIWGRKHYNGKK